MDADFSVELGPPDEDATLDFPWPADSAGGARYVDLKRHPGMLDFVPEAIQYPELRRFLQVLNSSASHFETAKCDVWFTEEMSEAEQIYDGACKFAAYIDLVFAAEQLRARLSFSRHEEVARGLVKLLKNAPELPGAAEIIIRRCYYHGAGPTVDNEWNTSQVLPLSDDADSRVGFYWTLYVFGYGDHPEEARRNWGEALRYIAAALQQL